LKKIRTEEEKWIKKHPLKRKSKIKNQKPKIKKPKTRKIIKKII